jgi:hypothetical protein
MWLQWDWGDGPKIAHAAAVCAWLAWSRFRVVIPSWDQQLGRTACLDTTLRKVGGAPTYLLTDKPRQSPSSTWPVLRCATRDGCAGPALRLEGGDLRAVRPPLTG